MTGFIVRRAVLTSAEGSGPPKVSLPPLPPTLMASAAGGGGWRLAVLTPRFYGRWTEAHSPPTTCVPSTPARPPCRPNVFMGFIYGIRGFNVSMRFQSETHLCFAHGRARGS